MFCSHGKTFLVVAVIGHWIKLFSFSVSHHSGAGAAIAEAATAAEEAGAVVAAGASGASGAARAAGASKWLSAWPPGSIKHGRLPHLVLKGTCTCWTTCALELLACGTKRRLGRIWTNLDILESWRSRDPDLSCWTTEFNYSKESLPKIWANGTLLRTEAWLDLFCNTLATCNTKSKEECQSLHICLE